MTSKRLTSQEITDRQRWSIEAINDRQRRYRIECLRDALVEADGRDSSPLTGEEEEAFLAQATAAIDAEATGIKQPFVWAVVQYEADAMPGVPWGWNYRAIEWTPAYYGRGCRHETTAATRALSKAEAITQHRQQCMGR